MSSCLVQRSRLRYRFHFTGGSGGIDWLTPTRAMPSTRGSRLAASLSGTPEIATPPHIAYSEQEPTTFHELASSQDLNSDKELLSVMYEVRGMTSHTTELLRSAKSSAIATPKYDGSTDVEDFLNLFEAISTHNGWRAPEMALRLRLAVTGRAAMGLQGDTYADLKARLRIQHSLSSEAARKTLKSLQLKSGDNIYHFADNLVKLVKNSYPEMEEEMVNKFAMQELIGMLPPNSQTAWLLKAQPPRNLEEVIQKIHEASAEGSNKGIHNMQSSEDVCEKMVNVFSQSQAELTKQHNTLTHQLVSQIAEGQKQILELLKSTQSSSRSEPRRCYACNQPGHFARDCRQHKPRTQSGNDAGQRY